MYIKSEERAGSGFWVGTAILLIGIAIGVFARPSEWLVLLRDVRPAASEPKDTASPPAPLHVNLSPAPTGAPRSPPNGLDTLRISLDPDAAAVLQAVRDRAMTRGLIVQEDDDTVAAEVELGGKTVVASARIKGDWLDHVETDKWSLRIKLQKETLLGMSVFSIQAPGTRGVLWEWLALAIARREGVLAPRATFVNVEINGNTAGIYYLEEHFSKELLESQQRREGPIVRWDEATHWNTVLQSHTVPDPNAEVRTADPLAPGLRLPAASIRAFGEKHLSEIESLSRALAAAGAKMRDLRTLGTSTSDPEVRAWLEKELREQRDATLESIVNVELLARYHAIASLLQVHHALIWHNMRYYLDPVLDRLEPVSFDNMPHVASDADPVVFRATGLTAEFGKCAPYYEGVFRELGRLCEPDWLDATFAALQSDLDRFDAALDAEAEQQLPTTTRPANMKQRLRLQQGYLRTLLCPADPLNVEAFYSTEGDADASLVAGEFEVNAWATTRAPVVVEGFQLRNGTFLAAGDRLVAGPDAISHEDGGGIVLPVEGATVRFRFPIDARLASLANTDDVKRALRAGTANTEALDFYVDIVFRPIAARETTREALTFRRYDPNWMRNGGRPAPPALDDALARHPFLELDAVPGTLATRPGVWDVAGDLVVPRDYELTIVAGTTLRFAPEAVLLSESAVHTRGTDDEPVVLEPVEGAESWSGVLVLGAARRSMWSKAIVRKTAAVERGGWTSTGGMTFYRSRVTLSQCLIEDTRAEDGCNVFATDFLLDRVMFLRCASDSFDGDFVTGRVVACTFQDGIADGVDLSGSDVDVETCVFLDMGDKAVSAGEDSRVRVVGGRAEGVSIGVASKDGSRVEVDGMAIRGARNYALTAFIKKDEFGASSLAARDVIIEGSVRGDTLVQTGCGLTLDGRSIETEELDVEALYRDKVLGQ